MTFLKNLLRFTQLPREKRRLVFYSEGKAYWPHLEGITKTPAANPRAEILYLRDL